MSTSRLYGRNFSRMHTMQRTFALVATYSTILFISRYLAYDLRFDFVIPSEYKEVRLLSILISLPSKLLFLLFFGQFGSLLTYFSIPDLIRITLSVFLANLVSYILEKVGYIRTVTPRGVILTDFVLSVCAIVAIRLVLRLYRERFSKKEYNKLNKIRNIAVLGAGDAGAQFVREIQSRPSLMQHPVFFLDDDRSKHGHEIHGVPVLGSPEAISLVRQKHPIDACILAMPSVSGRRLQELNRILLNENIKVEIIPSLAELATGRIQISKIRPVQLEDLLGRQPIDLNNDKICEIIENRVVLVTGAGGSIGSELCRQILLYNPRTLLLVEQCEAALFNIESELLKLGYLNTFVPLVADILDQARMYQILSTYKPSILFHAAAHKHVYMMERQPAEAVKNNTTGTRLLAELAILHKLDLFILISTDKAINPTSVMGASKRMAELHLQTIQSLNPDTTRFLAVRFGNVLGSSGSVIPIFKKQIEDGGPVTVTHPDVTRYFMTIPEAVGLILQTLLIGKGGEIFVLDMGESVKIIDLARQLIELSGFRPDEDIEIKITGLRPGEKLYEELQHMSENLTDTIHPRIKLLRQSRSSLNVNWSKDCILKVESICGDCNSNQLKLLIKEMIPEYTPYLD